jgi:hypothetical protein
MELIRAVVLGLFGIIYLGLVLMTYTIFGPSYRLILDIEAPVRSIERLLIWIGVRILHAGVRILRASLDLLSDASAEVGDWFVRRAGRNVQAAYRSRFL